MADPRRPEIENLGQIENLVEASVFHPSPCRRLRERVLRDAVQATHRQKIWRQFTICASAVSGTALVVFLVVQYASHHSSPPTTPPDAGPVRVQIYSPGHIHYVDGAQQPTTLPGQSLGEALYRGDQPAPAGDGPIPEGQSKTHDSTNPGL